MQDLSLNHEETSDKLKMRNILVGSGRGGRRGLKSSEMECHKKRRQTMEPFKVKGDVAAKNKT